VTVAVALALVLVCCVQSTSAVSVPAWSLLPSQGNNPVTRYSYAMCEANNTVVVSGGVTGSVRTGAEIGDLFRYHSDTDIWESIHTLGVKPARTSLSAFCSARFCLCA
jgi:hypothetical protein